MRPPKPKPIPKLKPKPKVTLLLSLPSRAPPTPKKVSFLPSPPSIAGFKRAIGHGDLGDAVLVSDGASSFGVVSSVEGTDEEDPTSAPGVFPLSSDAVPILHPNRTRRGQVRGGGQGTDRGAALSCISRYLVSLQKKESDDDDLKAPDWVDLSDVKVVEPSLPNDTKPLL